MAFADLTANLNLNIRNFSNALRQARGQVRQWSSDMVRESQRQTDQLRELEAHYRTLNQRLHTIGASARDVSRIVSGIVVAQTFYRGVDAIREATRSLWEFNTALDYAQVTYSALFGSTQMASGFLQELQQFSVDTIFEFKDLEGMSRKLLAYGIEYENLMYIIQGLTNLGTLSGDPAALERLAVAIGQINAKGTLKAEEIRQLTNAYVPMYDILREKMGLTDEDFKNIGNLGISAADTINAIVEYSNEKFGDTANAAMYTITGLNNRIVDSIKVMGADMLQPLTNAYKSFALFLAEQLNEIYAIYKASGIGGVFEHLVPSEMWQQQIREFIANLKNAISIIIATFMTMWPYVSQIINGFVSGLNVVLAVFNGVGSVVVAILRSFGIHTPILQMLTNAFVGAAFAAALFVGRAMAGFALAGLRHVFIGIANAVLALSMVLIRNPIVAGLLMLGGVLAAVTRNANGTSNAISNLVRALSSYSIGGDTADDILQPTVNTADQGADTVNDFWDNMTEGAENAEDAINGTDKAAKKAAKSLLSFDEVFRLNEPTSSGNSNSNPGSDLSGIEDLAGALGGLGGALIPEIPSFKDFARDFVKGLYDDLWESLRTIASGAASGALIGGLVGFAIGGLVTKTMAGAFAGAKLGVKIGTIVGAGFAGFWSDIYKEMEGSILKIAGAGGVGTLVGGLIGMVFGAFATRNLAGALAGARIGAGIGGVIGMGLGTIWAAISEEMTNIIEGLAVGGSAGLVTGALAGFVLGAFSTRTLAGAIGGAKLGAKIGAGVGALIGGFFGTASDTLKDQIKSLAKGIGISALVGAFAGFVLGAFVTRNLAGAVTGAKIGTAMGALIGATTEQVFATAGGAVEDGLSGLLADVQAASYGALIGGLAGMIVGAVVGLFAGGVGALPGAKIGATIGTAIGGLGAMIIQYLNGSGSADAIVQWFRDLGAKVSAAWNAIWNIETFRTVMNRLLVLFEALWSAIAEWFTGLGEDIKVWWSNTWLVQKWKSGWDSVKSWYSDLKTNVSVWFTERIADIKNWWEHLWDVSGWIAGWELATNWFVELLEDISLWFTDRIADIRDWWKNLWDQSKWLAGWESVVMWFSNLKASISAWFTERITDIKNWWSKLWKTGDWVTGWNEVLTWFNALKTSISEWFTGRATDIKNWWSNIWTTTGWSTAWSKVSAWFSTFKSDMSGWFTDRKDNVKTWWSNLWSTTNWSSGWSKVKDWFKNLKSAMSDWFTDLKTSIGSWWDNLWDGKSTTVKDKDGSVLGKLKLGGHATGGIFNREHIARFAEGNKAEAIIPLENARAMQPFVDAVSNGLLGNLAPALMQAGNNGTSNDLPPMYVGTLIADERGLKQLYKKFNVIKAQEDARRGIVDREVSYGI